MISDPSWKFHQNLLTHRDCGQGTPYCVIELGQHWSGNGLQPDGTKPLPEAIWTYHTLVFIPWQCLVEYSVCQYTSFMKFTRLKFVKGSLYMSGAQCINLDRVCSTSADALVTDAARAPVDVMLPMCILQTLSFHWCRFLSYPCTVCMSRERERD